MRENLKGGKDNVHSVFVYYRKNYNLSELKVFSSVLINQNL